MSFKVDYNNTGIEPIKPGEYEVTPVKFDIQAAQSGNMRVIVNYLVRSDVSQAGQGQEIMYDNFTVTENSMWRFNQASKAAGFPDGVEFSSVEDWANAFMNRPVRVVVGEKTYNNKTFPEVKSFKESQHQKSAPVKNDFNSDPFANSKPIDISDDDLPF